MNTEYQWCGLGGGNYCYCDSTTYSDPSSLPASSCDALCYGSGSYACGGTGKIGLYSATVSFTPIIPKHGRLEVDLSSYSYYGCFADLRNFRVLNETQTSFQLNDPQFCCNYCAAVDHAWCGVQNGRNCYCGKTTTSATQVVSTDCSVGCDGAPDVLCGVRLRMNIYSATVSIPTETATTIDPADHTSTAEPTSASDKSSSLSGGAITGIVIGVVAGLSLLGMVFWFLRSRSRRSQPVEMEDASRSTSEPRALNKEPRELTGQSVSPELPAPNMQPVELDTHTGR